MARVIGTLNGGAIRAVHRYVCITETLACELAVSRRSLRLVDPQRAWVWVDRRLFKRKARRASRR